MYCNCGTAREMKKLQEKQPGQATGETINYLHCDACGRNFVPPIEKKKLEALEAAK